MQIKELIMKKRLFILLLPFLLAGCNSVPSSEQSSHVSQTTTTEDSVVSESSSTTSESVVSETSQPSSETATSVSEETLVAVSFTATTPEAFPANAYLKLAGNFNEWNPLDPEFALERVDDQTFTFVLNLPLSEVGTTLEYKYVKVYDGQTENGWKHVEGDAGGGEIANRTHVLKESDNTITDSILSFKNNE